MINKYTNKQRGLLAVIMAMVMVFAGAAFVAAEVDAAEGTTTTVITIDDSYSGLSTLASGNYELCADITKPITVPEGVTATLDLNGKNITVKDVAAITNEGTLTITGTGTVKVTGTEDVPTIKNNVGGIMTLNGGSYDRESTGSMYTIQNQGEMTINEGVTVTTQYVYGWDNGYKGPSLIANGWSNGSDNEGQEDAVLTINGGTFTSGLNTLKNDDWGVATINGGTFNDNIQAVILNWNELTIDGGTFNPYNGIYVPEEMPGVGHKPYTIINGEYNSTYGVGKLTITGGTFNDVYNYTVRKQGDATTSVGIIEVKDTVEDTVKVFIPSGKSLDGTIKYGSDSVTLSGTAGTEGVLISKGSVVISGEVTGDLSVTADGKVLLDGVEFTGNSSLTVEADADGDEVIIDSISVSENATLAVKSNVIFTGANVIDGILTTDSAKITIAENSTMILNGIATGATVENLGTISVGDSNAKLPTTITGDGSINASAIQENVDIGGIIKSDATFGIEQIVTIVSDTEIIGSEPGATENITVLTIKGTLIIPEGVTLTIGEYSALIIDGYNAKLINNGTIVVESEGVVLDSSNISTGGEKDDSVAIAIYKASAENNGTIILDYAGADATNGFNGSFAMHIEGTVFQNNGTILIEEDNALGICRDDAPGSEDVTALNNNSSSEIVSYGAIVGYINNKSTITVDGYVLASISMQSTDAVLNIIELRSMGLVSSAIDNTLIVDDDGLKYGKITFDKVNTVKVNVDVSNEYALQGLIVKPVIKTSDENDNGKIDDNEYYNLFDISGSLVNETEKSDANASTIVVTLMGRTIVSSELSVSEDVTIAGADSNNMMYITGNVMLSKDSVFTADYVTVYGKMISEITTNLDDDNFIASKYEIKADLVNKTPAQIIYTTLAQTIADGATKIECIGDVTIDTEVTIPAGTTVKASGITVEETGFLTLADGAKLTANDVDVDGVFSVENKKNLSVSATNITSDVVTSNDKSVLYSGLAYALSVATDGQTVEISSGADDEVLLKFDATIKIGVILDTNGKNLKVDNDVTLTIEGVLFLDNSKISVAEKNTEGTNGAGEIVLNGTIKSVKAMDYNIGSTPLSAAYYVKIENSMAYNYVEPVSVAAPKILEADEAEMEIKSFVNDMKIGNVSFTGTTEKAVTVTVIGNVNGNITVEEGTVAIQSGKFVGTVTDGVGTIGLDGTASGTADKALKVASVTDDDEKAFTVSGEFAPSDKKKVTLSGEVVIAKFKATPVTVEGNVKVIDASNISVLTVNGTVTIPNEVTLTVEDAYVFGSITVSEPTDKPAGKLVATDLYVGLEKKDVYKTTTGASASVTGNTSVSNHLFVLAGTTIPEDLVKEDTPYQELYVEGELWMTIYALGTDLDVPVNQIPVDDVKFEGWASEEGKDGKDNFTVKIENKKVYADIEYDVYVVSVQASEGIDDVYIDGILMLSTGQYNLYGATVAAGTHTISYTLANGYTGEAKMIVDGKEVSGYTFTAEGDFGTMDDVDYQIILQGIEKAPAEVGGGDAPVADKDEGMDLTDILLIVLVVLIVIMAIIVALRMMRS